MESVELKLKKLPRDLKNEVEDYVDYLLERKCKKSSKKPNLNWIGGLREFKDQYTSLELQKKADEWRG
ncbi:MAG TPA: DUF2281 domain-containing protein [Candidatus Deferrimicrobium sp.]|nr:DUF2281 domain-containing protein [Candidatus Deferrimicrobium sp.]